MSCRYDMRILLSEQECQLADKSNGCTITSCNWSWQTGQALSVCLCVFVWLDTALQSIAITQSHGWLLNSLTECVSMCIVFLLGSTRHHGLFSPELEWGGGRVWGRAAGIGDRGGACLSSSTEQCTLASAADEKFIQTPLQYTCLLKRQNRQPWCYATSVQELIC